LFFFKPWPYFIQWQRPLYVHLSLLEEKAMLHKLKVTSYWLIILFVLILPSQAVAQCLTQDECAAAAQAKGLQLGGAGYDFAGPYGTKGCYTYGSGKYKGMVYFGTGGTEDEMVTAPAPPKFRVWSCWVGW